MVSLFLLMAGMIFGPAVVVSSPALVPLGLAAGFFWVQAPSEVSGPVDMMADEALPVPIEAELPLVIETP